MVPGSVWNLESVRRATINQVPVRPKLPGGFNGSGQHLLILLDKEVAHGDITDMVHGRSWHKSEVPERIDDVCSWGVISTDRRNTF